MLIGKRWRLSADSLNLSIEERVRVAAKENKPSHINWYPRAYFPPSENGFKNALIWLRDQGVTADGLKDVKAILKAIEESTETITKALRLCESHEKATKPRKARRKTQARRNRLAGVPTIINRARGEGHRASKSQLPERVTPIQGGRQEGSTVHTWPVSWHQASGGVKRRLVTPTR